MTGEQQRALLRYVKDHWTAFEKGGVSSNEVRYFAWEGTEYVLKMPRVTGENQSPFWAMMEGVFQFSFARQMRALPHLDGLLRRNPHIPAAHFAAAGEGMMIFERMAGSPWPRDEFPKGTDNAARLGKYIGFNHQRSYAGCGIVGQTQDEDFFQRAFAHMERTIAAHWSGTGDDDRRMRALYAALQKRGFQSARHTLIMTDMSADQFLFDPEENLAACVDLDAVVIGPAEWELSFLHSQVADWVAFRAGYETYLPMPRFEETAVFFYFLMALNSYEHKDEINAYWARYLPL